MLDDLKLIHTRDSEDSLGIALKQWQQYQYNFHFNYQLDKSISNVIVVGMGGSGLAAKAFSKWPGINLPFEVNQEYELPSYVLNNSLLIVSSYSGNTEEELAHLNEALARPVTSRPILIVITSGGKLKELATSHNLPTIDLPTGFQPRYTFGYQLRALCEIAEKCLQQKGIIGQLEEASNWLKDQLTKWDPVISTKDNYAKQIAQDVVGKSIVIYSSSKFFSAAYKWKISFNENAKSIAWCNQYSEFNHNEFLGWTNLPVEKPYAIIDLRSQLDNSQIQKRFVVSEQLLSGKRPAPEIINLVGDNMISQLLWAIALGDFVSLYTAILSGINPTPVDLIEELKKRLE